MAAIELIYYCETVNIILFIGFLMFVVDVDDVAAASDVDEFAIGRFIRFVNRFRYGFLFLFKSFK